MARARRGARAARTPGRHAANRELLVSLDARVVTATALTRAPGGPLSSNAQAPARRRGSLAWMDRVPSSALRTQPDTTELACPPAHEVAKADPLDEPGDRDSRRSITRYDRTRADVANRAANREVRPRAGAQHVSSLRRRTVRPLTPARRHFSASSRSRP